MNNFKKPLLVMTLAVSLSLGANVSFADNENNKSETNVKAILDNSSKTETTKIQVKLDENNKVISNKNQNNKEEKKEEVKKQTKAAPKTGVTGMTEIFMGLIASSSALFVDKKRKNKR